MPRGQDYAYKDAEDVAKCAIAYGAENISRTEDRKDAQEYITNIPKQDWAEEKVSISNLTPEVIHDARTMVNEHYKK